MKSNNEKIYRGLVDITVDELIEIKDMYENDLTRELYEKFDELCKEENYG
jgi:hypothetical protein